jgi:hypothetical protein
LPVGERPDKDHHYQGSDRGEKPHTTPHFSQNGLRTMGLATYRSGTTLAEGNRVIEVTNVMPLSRSHRLLFESHRSFYLMHGGHFGAL